MSRFVRSLPLFALACPSFTTVAEGQTAATVDSQTTQGAAPHYDAYSESNTGEYLLNDMLSQVDLTGISDALPASSHCPESQLAPQDLTGPERAGASSQYIYNTAYAWMSIARSDGFCVFLFRPVSRMLSQSEATVFLVATRYEFDVPEPTPSSQSDAQPSTEEDSEFYIDLEDLDEQQRSSLSTPDAPTSDPRSRLLETGHPYRALSMVQVGTGAIQTGSAVQISPYTYATATHVVVNSSTGEVKPNIRIFPGYRLPNPTTSLSVAAVDFDPSFLTASSSARMSRDLAFLRVNKARPLPTYPQLFGIAERFDIANGQIGLIGSDPWILTYNQMIPGCPTSWQLTFYVVGSGAHYLCRPWSTVYVSRTAMGYPDSVAGTSNTINHYPYAHSGLFIGQPNQYRLVHPSSYTNPIVGLQTFVSAGQSGGPIFGRIAQHYVEHGVNKRAEYYHLLGIVTNSVTGSTSLPLPATLATGRFSYNWTRWEANQAWNPNTFTATPNPVYTSTGQGYWTLSWNAPGYSEMDVWGVNSLVGPIETFLGTVGSSGSAPQVNDVGMIGKIRFYPHGDRSFKLGEVEVKILRRT